MAFTGYSTATEVRDLLPKVTTVVMGDTAVETKITDADRMINTKLGNKYTVPFSTSSVPPLINTLSKNIAAYFVMRTVFTKDGQNKNEWTDTFKEAIKQLNELAEGKGVVLDSSGNELTRASEPIESTTQNYHPVFNMDAPEDSTIDSDLLDDIATEREND